MTTGEQGRTSSTTPEIGHRYKEAAPMKQIEGQASCTSSVEAGIPLANTVFASSSAERREVKVKPDQIKRSLESLERNRKLQNKGLG